MKINKITTEVKYIALKTPFITALRRVEQIEFVRVSVSCQNGLTAFGEAPATKAITGEDIKIILNSIESVKELFYDTSPAEALELLHDSRTGFQIKFGMTESERGMTEKEAGLGEKEIFTLHHPKEVRHSRLDLESSLLGSIGSSAKAALDMAFISLIAQSKNIPLYKYFGADKPIPLQTDITISLKDIDEMLEDSKTAFLDGKNILKVKLGSDIKHSIKVIQKISQELPNAEILVDANQAWSLNDSLEFVNAMKDVKIELIEQPVIADDLQGLKSITNATNIPILADEAAFNLEDVIKVVESKSANMINIKLMKCGGLTKAVQILEYAREQKITCMLGSMLEGPISINAALHLAMAYSDVIKYIDLDSPLLYKDPSDELDFDFTGDKINYRK